MLSKKQIRFLTQLNSKKGRQSANVFVVEGVKLINDILQSDYRLVEVYYIKEHQVLMELLSTETRRKKLYELHKIIFTEISESELAKISTLKSPNQPIALVEMPKINFNEIDIFKKLILVLDGIRDPGNLGTIIRTADWFGIDTIVCSIDTVDCYNSKVIQASMGSITRVKVVYIDIADFIAHYSFINKNENYTVIGTYMNGDSIYDIQLPEYGCIIMGNEGKGISTFIEPLILKRIAIPQYQNINPKSSYPESLNVSIATAIICSEFRRRLLK